MEISNLTKEKKKYLVNLCIICKARGMSSKAGFVFSEKQCQGALIFTLDNGVPELGFSSSAKVALPHSPVTLRFLCLGTAAWPRGSQGAERAESLSSVFPSFPAWLLRGRIAI